MRIYVDENIPQQIATRLRATGHVLKHRQREIQGNLTTLTEAIVDIRSPLL